MTKEKLRVAVIGAGRWSATAHLPGFHRSPLADLAVICDLDREIAEKRAREFSVPDVSTDVEKVLARKAICWIVHAFRQLSLEELQHALAVERGMLAMDPDSLVDGSMLTSVCCGLVVIDEDTEVIRLVRE